MNKPINISTKIALPLGLSFILLFFQSGLFAQEVVATSGDYNSTAQGSLSWTLGEVVTETVTNGPYILTQGFQQDYENLLEIEETQDLITFNVFPNPFTDFVTITTERDVEIDVYIRDAQSKVVLSQSVLLGGGLKQTSIALSELAPGCYFVTIDIPELKYTTTKRMIKISTNE